MAATTSLPPPAPRPTAWEALQSFNLNDSLQERFARVPSQRKALMFGMAGGTCIGALRFISTRRGWSSANWGVYSFVFLSSISYYELSKKRQTEVEQIQQVVTKMNQVKPSPKLTANLASEGERLSEEKTTTADQTQNKKKYWLW
ncbi:hypothetical protein PtA15_3A152 [Puccinia triticina]|uniref:Cytochrome c oxidase assembly protein COX20, mitochondrial n=1 Tax=Puccinia triticina TaxID=208348 RepID=A0ABY7CCZ2_9BASI|nr:uncharacterized protein PtA15_3A152 [Puccinia triticina]WAQ82788.1 hypothetical protein PtA15_3A152 [Puccinia triticina]WAR53629.1 hypothetical protein PtB15_3B137 [Puccinia triticina]